MAAFVAGASLVVPGIGASATVVVTALLGLLVAQTSSRVAINIALGVGLTAGVSRRLLDYYAPDSSLTSLIVLLPGVIIVGVVLWGRRRQTRTEPSKVPRFWMLVVMAVILAAINPFGAGLIANIATSSLLIGYLLCFLLTYRGTVSFKDLVWPIISIGSINSIYMISQHFMGLTPWDQLWVRDDGYAALYLTATEVRPLGVTSSAAESAALCAIVFVLSLGSIKFVHPVIKLCLVGAAALSLVAVTLSGTRTFLILSVLGLAFLLAAGRKRPWLVLSVVLAILVPVVVLVSSRLSDVEASGAARSLNTFSGGEDLSQSTIPIHLDLLVNGIARGVSSVVGTGSGQLGRLAGNSNNAEIDFANLPLMSGLLGLIAVSAMYIAFFQRISLILRNGERNVVSALVLVAVLGQWMTVGFYGVLAVVWLAFGEFCKVVNDRTLDELDDNR